MASTQLQWEYLDKMGDHGYRGVTVPVAVTTAAADTFVTALSAFSDGALEAVKLSTVSAHTNAKPTAGSLVREVGTVIIKNKVTLARFAISIPALKDTSKIANMKLNEATKDAVLAAFATMTGFTVTDLTVTDGWYTGAKR